MSGVQHDLFGGAIRVWLPGPFTDASGLRQVPDNQEVLLSKGSDVSIIVEVLQLATQGTSREALDQAVRFHFDSLANDNSATSFHVDSVNVPANASAGASDPPTTPSPALISGTQRVCKFDKASEEADVHIWLALWRITAKNVDLVLSVNDPSDASAVQTAQMFEQISKSLKIEDFGLFA